MEKGLAGRPKGRAAAQTALLLFIEIEAADEIVVSWAPAACLSRGAQAALVNKFGHKLETDSLRMLC